LGIPIVSIFDLTSRGRDQARKGIAGIPATAFRGSLRQTLPGFTLVELILVITIIAVLAALVVPRFAGRSQQARVTAAKQDIVGTLGLALDLFEQDTGRYPTTEEGLQVLISAPTQGSILNWNGPYIKSASVPLDPWGRPYQYTFPSQLTNIPGLYDLVSAGPDGQSGTADDISNQNTEVAKQAR
jgi:general secretion pathway protein G